MPEPVESPARHNVTFPTVGGTAHGYLALPPSGEGPGVIVIQEWWGLTDHIADIADRIAAEGFVALAPDLYGGRVAHDAAEAARMMQQLPVPRGVELLSGAVDHLLGLPRTTSDRIGSVGFCMGGGFVLYQAATDPRVAAAIPFYGVIRGELPDFSRLRAQILGHYGELDAGIPMSSIAALRTAIKVQSGISADLRVYPADHAFFNDQREAFHPESADAAWRSTIDLLRRLLG